MNNVNNFGKLFQNPDTYAQTYATKNNMSVADAKKELKTKFGAPDVNTENTSIFSYDKSGTEGVDTISGIEDIESELKELASKCDLPSANIDPDSYAKQYADENGLSLTEAKNELKSKFGKPTKAKQSDASKSANKSGNPKQGVDPDEYIKTYADENGLTFDEAKAELQKKFGAPQEKTGKNK